jgi:hypothetical protein
MSNVGKGRIPWNNSTNAMERVKLDPSIFVAILNACASVMALMEKKLIHFQII